ncbi:ECF transporter S component [bacterium]|jgi:ECF transporter S component (folate family)|nr:ECF transporter S component [bacterium]
MKSSKTYKMAVAASMAALSLILDVISVRSNISKFTIYGLPLLLAGFLFGPWVGALAGAVVGFISQMLFYGLSYTTALWMIAPIFWGFLSGLMSKYLIKDNFNLKKVILITFTTSLCVTAINSCALYLDSLIFDYPLSLTVGTIALRFAFSLAFACVYCLVIYISYPRLYKIIKKPPESPLSPQ